MRALLRGAYDAAVGIARMASLVAPASGGKVMRSLAARRGVRARFQNWAALNRDRSRPLLWLHAPSVGEGLQARAVMQLVRAYRPEVQIVYTFYSPSAEQFALGLQADYTDYLPFDTYGDARATVTALAPTALVYSKLDLWPNLTLVASLRGIRIGMISATVSEESGRRGWLAANLLREAYSRLDAVGAVSDIDADRVRALGARPEVVFVTGDTRYDQVWMRAEQAGNAELVDALRSDVFTIVAGSTWPADEEQLLRAFARLHGKSPGARLIIAPHEPTEQHVHSIERKARKAKLSCERLSASGAGAQDVVIVDRLGVLGDLYSLAGVAFVGGGFHDAGLHSVLEPAAFGAPVLFGPKFRNSRDAALLIRARGGSSVRNADELYASLRSLMQDDDLRASAGEAARALVAEGTGAAHRSYELVDALLAN